MVFFEVALITFVCLGVLAVVAFAIFLVAIARRP